MNTDATIKDAVLEYFSDALQYDETPVAGLKRNQLKKQLLEWARIKTVDQPKTAVFRSKHFDC
jgi:hypothetical protein